MRKLFVILMVMAIFAMTATLFAGNNPDSPEYEGWKKSQIYTPESLTKPVYPSGPFTHIDNQDRDQCELLIPVDGTFTLAMSPNDDSWFGPITLPFTFSLYGAPYTQCWINNNGNITFDGGYSSYTPWGFPIDNAPMVAPFFADVDTRGTGSVWYKVESNHMIVIWDHVGYYSYGTDRLNTFELIISDGTFALIGAANNVAFSYADMAWTTGDASGGTGGLGGTPATVGINKGDGVEFAQIGRFDHEGTDYDGAYNNNDGVDWLDCQLFLFNTGGDVSNVAPVFVTAPPSPVELTVGDVWSFDVTVIAPEQDQLVDATISHPIPMSYSIIPANTLTFTLGVTAEASMIGTHLITITATDDGTPPLSTDYQFEIIISDEGSTPVELSSFTATLTATNDVQISWTSQSETNLLGYHVYRNENTVQNDALRITPALIPATNTSELQAYDVTDPEVEIGHTYYYWLESFDAFSSQYFGPVSINVQGEVPPVTPENSSLGNAYPNPFKANDGTVIDVDIKAGETGFVTIFNILGQAVRTFEVRQGAHAINWNGLDSSGNACSSGVYFYKLSTPSMNQTRKLVIVK
jgi:hypothetical protein